MGNRKLAKELTFSSDARDATSICRVFSSVVFVELFSIIVLFCRYCSHFHTLQSNCYLDNYFLVLITHFFASYSLETFSESSITIKIILQYLLILIHKIVHPLAIDQKFRTLPFLLRLLKSKKQVNHQLESFEKAHNNSTYVPRYI